MRAGKGFTLFISSDDINDKIIKLLQDLGVLIDWVTETGKHEIYIKRKQHKWVDFFLLC